jgi:DSF synthase
MGAIEFIGAAEDNLVSHKYKQLLTRFDADKGIIWEYMNPIGIPNFNSQLIDDMLLFQDIVKNSNGNFLLNRTNYKINYHVLASSINGVFNLGGQLDLFRGLIVNKDYESLKSYAIKCITMVNSQMNHFNLPVVSIALVQGHALGGGFEAALTCDIIIAEKSSKLGFPEILFNLFPGMGSFSFLSRKIGAAQAEKIILSGQLYTAEELYKMGVVDILVEDSMGEEAVYEYIDRQSRRSNGYMALKKAQQICNPISYQELKDITLVWVDAALNLNDKDLKVMDRFVRSQQKQYCSITRDQKIRNII